MYSRRIHGATFVSIDLDLGLHKMRNFGNAASAKKQKYISTAKRGAMTLCRQNANCFMFARTGTTGRAEFTHRAQMTPQSLQRAGREAEKHKGVSTWKQEVTQAGSDAGSSDAKPAETGC